MRTPLLFLSAVLAFAFLPASAFAQDPLVRSTPGLVLATDGRYANCDVLLFNPDGTRLFACGDDKVVRRWEVADNSFSFRKMSPLRWPIFREERGSIFAMALSPDVDADYVAIGGFGRITGMVMVLDRYKGNVEHALEEVTSPAVVWSIAFSPSGKHIVYGTDHGEIFIWDIGNKKTRATLLPGTKARGVNRVRRIAFVSNNKDETRFVSIAQDGIIRLGDVNRPNVAPTKLDVSFNLPNLYQVAVSPDRRWLAATGEGSASGKSKNLEQVELIDLQAARRGTDSRKFLKITRPQNTLHVPHSLAFDHASERLAVGCRVHPLKSDFYREIGGLIYLFDLKSGERLPATLNVGYRPDAIAFRPTPPKSPKAWKNQLATAGGNNHEVRLWDISGKGKVLDVIESPGSCLWGVALSKPDKNDKEGKPLYLAWKEKRADNPTHPNKWGAGEWRIFDLENKRIVSKTPDNFDPVLPLEEITVPGTRVPWRVEFTKQPYVWRITGPGNTSVDLTGTLYNPARFNLPRCYTFIPYTDKTGKAPVYVAIGHTWGASVYECTPGKVTLSRVLVGHESEVMAIGTSADGKTLVTASRDQTLAGWSLLPWKGQPELGARFVAADDGKRLLVREMAPGSPAWEPLNPMTGADDEDCRLTEGQEIEFISFKFEDRHFYFDPLNQIKKYTAKPYYLRLDGAKKVEMAQALRLLENVQPNSELIFFKKIKGKDVIKLTTVKQRPMWKFFPERLPEDRLVVSRGGLPTPQGKDWVVYRWRDYFYDTNSLQADRYVGWQVNVGRAGKPEFYSLEQFRGTDEVQVRGETRGFHKPDKVWKVVHQRLIQAENVNFLDFLAPQVTLTKVTDPGKGQDLVVRVAVKPRDNSGGQKLSSAVHVWVNDYRHPVNLKVGANGEIDEPKLNIPRTVLRRGANRITLIAYNAEGGRGEQAIAVEYKDDTKYTRTMRALCVGVNNYKSVQGYKFGDLKYSKPDAEEMARVLKQHEGSALYQTAQVTLLTDKEATASRILKELEALTKGAKPDDWLVVFLSGHGYAEPLDLENFKPGTFFFLCANTNRKLPESHLTSKMLYEALAKVTCAKMVLLDCCHSGDMAATNPVRDLARDGDRIPFLIFSACKANQQANEPGKDSKGKHNHGFFTQSILYAVKTSAEVGKKKSTEILAAQELGMAIKRGIHDLMVQYGQDPDDQVPEFLPAHLENMKRSYGEDPLVLCRPK